MRALSGNLLLTAWERCAGEHDINRAVTMLALALPASSREQLAALPLAEHNVLLLRLHEVSFGLRIHGFAAFSPFGEPMEFTFAARSLGDDLDAGRTQSRGERDTV